MVAAWAFFLIMLIYSICVCFSSGTLMENIFSIGMIRSFINNFITASTIILISVPEGLPIIVVYALAFSASRIKKENNLVREINSLEAMAFVDEIITDKTGTITKYHYTVTKIFAEGSIHHQISIEMLSERSSRLLSLAICNSSKANPKFTIKNGNLIVEQTGNKDDCALLELVFRWGLDYQRLRD
jgi:P-type Ca2+ transporter type 2C